MVNAQGSRITLVMKTLGRLVPWFEYTGGIDIEYLEKI
jgi:hypothetical protein